MSVTEPEEKGLPDGSGGLWCQEATSMVFCKKKPRKCPDFIFFPSLVLLWVPPITKPNWKPEGKAVDIGVGWLPGSQNSGEWKQWIWRANKKCLVHDVLFYIELELVYLTQPENSLCIRLMSCFNTFCHIRCFYLISVICFLFSAF